jgi:molybdopterin molybdotransferase
MITDRPDPDTCGCGAEPEPGLLSFDAALARGLALAQPVAETETLPLAAAIGRVLAAPLRSPIPLPPFDNSAMDGYALATGELSGPGPWLLPVAGAVAAGAAAVPPRPRGAALRILTGAPVPADCDAVVMQEHILRRDGAILIDRRPRPGRNIRRRGEDLPFGAPILEAGRLILAREAAAAAATGAGAIPVRRRVRIAFFCSGSELVAPGTPLGPGQIYNSNRFGLIGALAQNWIEATDLGAVPDDPAALTRALTVAASADLVVSTGGVSVGDADHLPRLVREAGGRLSVLKIAMKPGKPLTLGRLGQAVWLGLPGNPVAAHVGWTLIGGRIAERLAGLAAPLRPKAVVRAGFTLDREPGRCEFRPARITGHDATGAPVAMILPGSFSARIAELAAADGLVAIPAEDTAIRPGHLLEFLPF